MKPKVKTLKNGLRIVTVPMKDNPTVTVLVMVGAGTRYETRQTNGLSHFLEHMCFKGTTKRKASDIVFEIESIGAVTNAFTGYDYTGYYAKGRSNLFPKLVDIVSDVYLNSTFPDAEIEKERGVITGEIDTYEDLPMYKAGMLFTESLYGDQPAGYGILGPKENIHRFVHNDFEAYHKKHYHAGNTIIVVSGGIDTKTVEQEIQKAFRDIPVNKKEKKRNISKIPGERILVQPKKTDQSHIVVGTRGIALGHKDLAAFEVMNGVLGVGMSSRLFAKLRDEMGAGYYITSDVSASDDTGEFAVATGTSPIRTKEVIQAIAHELQRIQEVKVEDQELNKVKESLVGRLYMGHESSDEFASMVAHQAIFNQPLKTLKEMEKEIRSVTAKDVLRVAKKYLKPESLHLVVIGPESTQKELKDVFTKTLTKKWIQMY